MMKVARLVIAGLSIGLLGACATPLGLEIQSARGLKAEGSKFNRALYTLYLNRAEVEMAENDHTNADLFARKAKAAARDELVLPEDLAEHTIPQEKYTELADARQRLMWVFDRGGREALPGQAALAQQSFDCWVEEQEENIQPPHIAACKRTFLGAIARVEPWVGEPAPPIEPFPPPTPVPMVERAPAPIPAPAPALRPSVPKSYLVFFDWDKANLTAEAKSILRKVAENARAISAQQIDVTGHADRSGPDLYNMGLSERRALAVRAELRRLRAATKGINVYARGERDPLVATPDGVREPQNRRAEIVLR